MKYYIFATAFIVAGLIWLMSSAPADDLIIYSGRSKALVDPIIREFQDQTGIKVKVRYGGTTQLAVALMEEGARSPADLFWAQDAGALGAVEKEGLLAPLPSGLLSGIPSRFRNRSGTWIATSGRARVLAYSTTRADLSDLATLTPTRNSLGQTGPLHAGITNTHQAGPVYTNLIGHDTTQPVQTNSQPAALHINTNRINTNRQIDINKHQQENENTLRHGNDKIPHHGNENTPHPGTGHDTTHPGLTSDARAEYAGLPKQTTIRQPVQTQSSGANSSTAQEYHPALTLTSLTSPSLRGRVGWAPSNGSFQAFVTAMQLVHGDDHTRDWLTAMKDNNTRIYNNNTAILQAIAAGEIDYGLTNHYYLLRALDEDSSFPVAQTFFAPGDVGNLINVAGIGILKTSKKQENARRFVEFLLSEYAQNFFTDEVHEYPVTSAGTGNPAQHRLQRLLELSPEVDLDELSDLERTLRLLREVALL